LNQKVLIIDDDPMSIGITHRAIQNESYNVYSAMNGKEAYNLAIEHRPDIILLDVNMPGLNGYDTCKIFKADTYLLNIPIIFVTATQHNIEKAFNVGAADYVCKPINETELKVRLSFQLERKRLAEEIKLLNLNASKKIEQQAADLLFANRKLIEALEEIADLKERTGS
jgi:DNA-binding response OmpR family regulator